MITAESSESDGVKRRTLETHLLIFRGIQKQRPQGIAPRAPDTQKGTIQCHDDGAREPKDAPPDNDMGGISAGFALLS